MATRAEQLGAAEQRRGQAEEEVSVRPHQAWRHAEVPIPCEAARFEKRALFARADLAGEASVTEVDTLECQSRQGGHRI
jgi:hypothetical protein